MHIIIICQGKWDGEMGFPIFRPLSRSSLKLKKDNVLNLFHPDQMKHLETYAKNQKLSFKKPNDVDKILGYAN